MLRRAELTISKRTVDGLSVEGKDAVFWDRELPGFGVRVYPSGARSMSSRAAAREDRSALPSAGMASSPPSDRIKSGENPVTVPPEPTFTVADLAHRYLETHVPVNCNTHTAGNYRGALDNHILLALGALPIGSVGQPQVSALHYGLRDTASLGHPSAVPLTAGLGVFVARGAKTDHGTGDD